MNRKKSLFEASEAAAAASRDFPYNVWLVVDAPSKTAKMVSSYIYHLSYKSRGYKPVLAYFGGKMVKGVYEIRVYDREKLCKSRRDTNIGEMVIEADLMSVPDGGNIEIIDEISGRTVYYRERD